MITPWIVPLLVVVYLLFIKKKSIFFPPCVVILLGILNYPIRIISISTGEAVTILGDSISILDTGDAVTANYIGLTSLIIFLATWYLFSPSTKIVNNFYYLFYSRIRFSDIKNKIKMHAKFARIIFVGFLIAISIGALAIKAGVNPISYILASNFYRLGVNQNSSLLKLPIDIACFISSYYGFRYLIRTKKPLIYALSQVLVVILGSVFGHRGLAVTTFLLPLVSYENSGFTKSRHLTSILPIIYIMNGLYASIRDAVYVSMVNNSEKVISDANALQNILKHSLYTGMHGFDSVLASLQFVRDGQAPVFLGYPFIEFLYPISNILDFVPNPTHVGFNNILHDLPWNGNIEREFAGGVVETFEGWSLLHFSYIGIIICPLLLSCFIKIFYTIGTRKINFEGQGLMINSIAENKKLVWSCWFSTVFYVFFLLTMCSSPAVAVLKLLVFSIILRLMLP